jgi:hypothetical protein
MKKYVILIICVITILCTFESCKKPLPPKIQEKIISIFKSSIARIRKADLRKASEVIKYFKYNNNMSGTIIFEDFTKNEVKAIVETAGIKFERKVSVKSLLSKTFKELNYSKAEYKDLGNGLIEVVIPYYSKRSYLKLLINDIYLPKVKNFIDKLSRRSSFSKFFNNNPYRDFKKLNISMSNAQIVQYIKSGIIVEAVFRTNNDERFGFSPDAA